MKFDLILGPSGSGKTEEILSRVKSLLEKGRTMSAKISEKIIILVPDQYTVSTERLYLNALGAETMPFLRILSIKRLASFVFTEYGVTMLAGLLKSEVAVQASLRIVDAFIAMKKYISNELIEQRHINKMVYKLDERVSLIENTFSKFDTFSNEIFFDGQIYDAHSLLLDIFNVSKKSIVIIDNYISKELLDVVCKTNKKITVGRLLKI